MTNTVNLTLIAIKGPKNTKRDRLRFIRSDGSQEEIEMPRQGILPHDLVHALVEQGFQLQGGFLGLVASGASPQFLLSKELPKTTETGIAESVVEAMQTQLAQGYFDYESFIYGVETACASRQIYVIEPLEPSLALSIFNDGIALNTQWQALAQTDVLTLNLVMIKTHSSPCQ